MYKIYDFKASKTYCSEMCDDRVKTLDEIYCSISIYKSLLICSDEESANILCDKLETENYPVQRIASVRDMKDPNKRMYVVTADAMQTASQRNELEFIFKEVDVIISETLNIYLCMMSVVFNQIKKLNNALFYIHL
jgi:hypothetical protein